MAACIPTASASASVAAETTTTSIIPSSSLRHRRLHHHSHSSSNVLFSLSSKPKLRLFSQNTQSALTRTVAAKAQLNNDGSSNDAVLQSKSERPAQEIKNGKPSSESVATTLATEDSISEFISQVAGLVKLVDSRDIVELQLKQHDSEILIRKKEAIEQASAPMIMMQSPSPSTIAPETAPPTSAPVATPAASPPPASPVAKPAKASVPPLKSPMAGTFYRSPAPGAPPFVKVGDKVQKGQVLCIIEAMKLMNEIEADQSGTVLEILAEDGKPVSIDTPLFAIQP